MWIVFSSYQLIVSPWIKWVSKTSRPSVRSFHALTLKCCQEFWIWKFPNWEVVPPSPKKNMPPEKGDQFKRKTIFQPKKKSRNLLYRNFAFQALFINKHGNAPETGAFLHLSFYKTGNLFVQLSIWAIGQVVLLIDKVIMNVIRIGLSIS